MNSVNKEIIMRVFIAVPFEEFQGHCAGDSRVFSSESAAQAYCERREQEGREDPDGPLYSWWEVVECELDQE